MSTMLLISDNKRPYFLIKSFVDPFGKFVFVLCFVFLFARSTMMQFVVTDQ